MNWAQGGRTKGFTLIELMVSLAIIGVLSTIGFVTYHNALLDAQDQRRKQDLNLLAQSLQ